MPAMIFSSPPFPAGQRVSGAGRQFVIPDPSGFGAYEPVMAKPEKKVVRPEQ